MNAAALTAYINDRCLGSSYAQLQQCEYQPVFLTNTQMAHVRARQHARWSYKVAATGILLETKRQIDWYTVSDLDWMACCSSWLSTAIIHLTYDMSSYVNNADCMPETHLP